MKKIVFLLLLLVNLSGCVGYHFSHDGDVVDSDTDFSQTDLSVRTGPPNRAADKINPDGTEMYVIQDEREWCGLTIWAVIPIPLWLPVCRGHIEVTYKDKLPIHITSQWPKGSGFVCGPFVLIPTGMDGGKTSICSSEFH